MFKRVAWIGMVLAAIAAFGEATPGVSDGDRYINPYALDPVLAGPLKNGVAKPGQVFKVGNAINPGPGQPDGDACSPQSGGRHSKITIWSISGGTVDIPENVEHYGCFPQHTLSKLPFVIEYNNVYGSQFVIVVKAGGLDKKGRAKDLVVDFTAELADDRGEPTVSRSGRIVVPVAGTPDLTVTTRVDALHPDELRPGTQAKFVYTVDAAGSTMDGLQFVARVPKGTTLREGSIYPASGVRRGSDILWNVDPATQFVCAITVDVAKRPKTRNAVAKYLAQGKVLGYSRRTAGNRTVPIKGFDQGRIQYAAASGINGQVVVGESVYVICSDWEAAGGPIDVLLNDEVIMTLPASQPFAPLTVPPFRDGDIEHVLSARQTGDPVDDPMPGKQAGIVEIATGKPQILNDDGSVARTLQTGGKIAVGEVDAGAADLATATMFGHLRVEGASSAVMLSFLPGVGIPPDSRLILAPGSGVRVSGVVRAAKIVLKAGKKSYAIAFEPQDLSAYTTLGKAGVVSYSSAATNLTSAVTGYAYMQHAAWVITGTFDIEGGVFFAEHGGTISAPVSGVGAVFVRGDLTIPGPIVLRGSDSGPLAAEGTLTLGK